MLEAIVVMGLTAGVLLLLNQGWTWFSKSSDAFSGRMDLEDQRNLIRRTFDCAKTRATAPVPCNDGTPLALNGKNGGVVVAVPQSDFGGLSLRASCTARVGELKVEWNDPPSPDWAPLLRTPLACPP